MVQYQITINLTDVTTHFKTHSLKPYFCCSMNKFLKKGFKFRSFVPPYQTPFDKLFDIFKEIITYTSGDFEEAIEWLRQLDTEYKLTDENYTIDNFIEDLKAKGYIKEEINPDTSNGEISITAKTERAIRQQALNQIFGKKGAFMFGKNANLF